MFCDIIWQVAQSQARVLAWLYSNAAIAASTDNKRQNISSWNLRKRRRVQCEADLDPAGQSQPGGQQPAAAAHTCEETVTIEDCLDTEPVREPFDLDQPASEQVVLFGQQGERQLADAVIPHQSAFPTSNDDKKTSLSPVSNTRPASV